MPVFLVSDTSSASVLMRIQAFGVARLAPRVRADSMHYTENRRKQGRNTASLTIAMAYIGTNRNK